MLFSIIAALNQEIVPQGNQKYSSCDIFIKSTAQETNLSPSCAVDSTGPWSKEILIVTVCV